MSDTEVNVTMNRTLVLSLTILAGLPAASVTGCTATTPAGTMTVQQAPPPPPPPQPTRRNRTASAPIRMSAGAT